MKGDQRKQKVRDESLLEVLRWLSSSVCAFIVFLLRILSSFPQAYMLWKLAFDDSVFYGELAQGHRDRRCTVVWVGGKENERTVQSPRVWLTAFGGFTEALLTSLDAAGEAFVLVLYVWE